MIEIHVHPPNKAESHPESCAQHAPFHPPNTNADPHFESRAYKKFSLLVRHHDVSPSKSFHMSNQNMGYAKKKRAKGHEKTNGKENPNTHSKKKRMIFL